ncbi:hypothetical protein Pan153_13900 [Gimesia panareensis]|uniref:Uncharacterized protein n=1 Tax=Gimesia panareensis TaxID=2527978 RepID=A0A518FK88_9PLAN|nr:hypothetical protein [Gimesia panareensis]QDV16758.1 hypothetical protein Pan153_13900 [Gimesia panareensis]
MEYRKDQICKRCGRPWTLLGILENAQSYWPELDVIRCLAPCCGIPETLQLENGLIHRGYIYAAGAPHFAEMEHYEVPGLTVVKSSDSLTYSLHQKEVTVTTETG